MCGPPICDPVSHPLIDGVLQCPRPGFDSAHLRPQQPHAKHVQLLAPHVLGPHIDDALKSQESTHRCGSDAVLPRAGLRDYPLLAHALHQQRLAQTVVDLVRTGVQQIFALQINFGSAQLLGKAPCEGQSGGTPGIIPQQFCQLLLKFRVALRLLILALQLIERGHQSLRHIAPAVNAKAPGFIPMNRNARLPYPYRIVCGAGEDPDVHSCFSNRRHSQLVFLSISRTAFTNARTFSGSFFPGLASTPETTSTPQGFKIPIASSTFCGVSPPATTSFTPPCRILSTIGTAFFQSNGFPVPPGIRKSPESSTNVSINPFGNEIPSGRFFSKAAKLNSVFRISASSPNKFMGSAIRNRAGLGSSDTPVHRLDCRLSPFSTEIYACVPVNPTSRRTLEGSSSLPWTKTPIFSTSSGSFFTISRAASTVMFRGLFS